MNSIQFAKNITIFAEDLLKLFTSDLEDVIANAIAEVYRSHLAHIESSLKSDKFRKEVGFYFSV